MKSFKDIDVIQNTVVILPDPDWHEVRNMENNIDGLLIYIL
jgi:hypothetical protein